ncbi:MAG: YvcK family protein [Candidatus Kerfeldbacteria bacterium]|nr:YvcK family protein [Candidatus Kerfeldbacteria bacterium]
MKRVVTIGGGSGQSTLLRHLKTYPLNITAVVSMVDDGASTGQLRRDYQLPPLGDVRRCVVALAQAQPHWQTLLEHRFEVGALAGHPVGNIILAGLIQTSGGIMPAVRYVSDWLDTKGRVLPVTLANTTLVATLTNGTVIRGETNIDRPQHDATIPIANLALDPAVPANPAVLDAIVQADLIVLTIGDLFTSLLPNLLVTGIAQAIATASAQLVYTCNRTTKWGETNRFSVLDYITTLERYLGGRRLDQVIVNTTPSRSTDQIQAVAYDQAAVLAHGIAVTAVDLAAADGWLIAGDKLAAEIYTLCEQ